MRVMVLIPISCVLQTEKIIIENSPGNGETTLVRD